MKLYESDVVAARNMSMLENACRVSQEDTNPFARELADRVFDIEEYVPVIYWMMRKGYDFRDIKRMERAEIELEKIKEAQIVARKVQERNEYWQKEACYG
jgi:hypothetical protein